ncbi:MAG: ribosome maturation factor RimM [Paramuribaculum sp.]|nr:ribosome maturation factor RimM [Paramuribaculum sp.]
MIREENLTIIGHLIKPHGIKGEISAELDADDINLQEFKCLIFDIDGIYVPFFVQSIRPKSHFTRLIKIQDIDTESDAAELSGKLIYVQSSELANISEYDGDNNIYLTDLIGYSVYNDAAFIGTIADIDDSTDNVLFIIKDNSGTTVYVPAVEEFISTMSEEQKTIILDLPEGLISLNN